MQIIDVQTAESYLREEGHLRDGESVTIEALSGGVSNCVLYVHRAVEAGPDFVLKQARQQLQVEAPWFCSPQRGWQEVATLKICQSLLAAARQPSPAGKLAIHVPEILFQDLDNYAYAMTAAPRNHTVWKSDLLQSRCDSQIAACCGELLALLHGQSWQHDGIRQQLANQEFFRDLRIDPYYRYLLREHVDLEPAIERLIESLEQQVCSLVHGDYSPKNLLVYEQGLMMVDFEVGHFGDPAFDLGFFLSHLVLKGIWSESKFDAYWQLTEVFWGAYWAGMQAILSAAEQASLEHRAVGNFAACLLARVDGKSPVEYLTLETHRDQVRKMARQLLLAESATWADVAALKPVN